MSKKGQYIRILFILLLLMFCGLLYANPKKVKNKIKFKTNKSYLRELKVKLKNKYKLKKTNAVHKALERGWAIKEIKSDGTIIEIHSLGINGMPNYYITDNLNAAKTIDVDDIWPSGSLGLSLTGSGVELGEWDGGKVRNTHQEFGGRVSFGDTASTISGHSTHVAGTLIAAGVDANAKGMSYQADLLAYDWDDDVSEMADAAGDSDLRVSNHSYSSIRGWYYSSSADTWYWYGVVGYSTNEDYKFGFYNDDARDWDNIAYNAPYYLIFKSAGNDRNDICDSTGHLYWDTGAWQYSETYRDTDGGVNGYDCLPPKATAKNLMVIGSCADIPGGYTVPGDVQISSFSNFGPTDDGRIKPDLVANGNSVYSTYKNDDADYASMNGTSMSTPSAAGAAGLLIQHYRNTHHNNDMLSSTLKALLINTAYEAGSNSGPDYKYGWGLLNAKGAAQKITENSHGYADLIIENTLNNNTTDTITYVSYGDEPIKVTIAWTDTIPSGSFTPALNARTKRLINDLDLRIKKENGSLYYPWILQVDNPSAAATTGDNDTDNVEQVYIANPDPGNYSIAVTHKDSLEGSSQVYSLIIDGLHKAHDTKAILSSYHDISIDGNNDFTSWEYIDSCYTSTDWGADDNLDSLFITYSQDTLYIGITGNFNDGSNHYVIAYIDRDFGKNTGVADMSNLTDNTDNPDNAISNILDLSTLAGFGAELAFGWDGNTKSGGIKRFETSAKYGTFDDIPEAIYSGDSTYVECGIGFNQIYNDTEINGNDIAIVVIISNQDGSDISNQIIPDSAAAYQNLAVIEFDSDGDSIPDNKTYLSVAINNPNNNTDTRLQTIIVCGTTRDSANGDTVVLFVNGIGQDTLNLTSSNDDFTGQVTLTGLNDNVSAQLESSGGVRAETITVNYYDTANVSIISPADKHDTNTNIILITGSIGWLKVGDTVQIFVNSSLNTECIIQNAEFSSTVALNGLGDSVTVIAHNLFGSTAQDSITVNYYGSISSEINIPSDNSDTSRKNILVVGTAANVRDGDTGLIYVNSVINDQLSVINGQFSGTALLIGIGDSITVILHDQFGRTYQDTITVNCLVDNQVPDAADTEYEVTAENVLSSDTEYTINMNNADTLTITANDNDYSNTWTVVIDAAENGGYVKVRNVSNDALNSTDTSNIDNFVYGFGKSFQIDLYDSAWNKLTTYTSLSDSAMLTFDFSDLYTPFNPDRLRFYYLNPGDSSWYEATDPTNGAAKGSSYSFDHSAKTMSLEVEHLSHWWLGSEYDTVTVVKLGDYDTEGVYPGEETVPILSFYVLGDTASGGDTLTNVKIKHYGAISDSITALWLYEDKNSDSQIQSSDTFVCKLIWNADGWETTNLIYHIGVDGGTFIVCADFSSTSTFGDTFQAYIPINGIKTEEEDSNPTSIIMNNGVFVINDSPVADAGVDTNISFDDTVYIYGDGSYDPDTTGNLYYTWTEVTNIGAALDNPYDSNTYFVPDTIGLYKFTLRVADDYDTGDPDTLEVSVIPGPVDTTIIVHRYNQPETGCYLYWAVVGDTGVNGYIIYRSTQVMEFFKISSLTDSDGYFDTTTFAGQTYYYRILAADTDASDSVQSDSYENYNAAPKMLIYKDIEKISVGGVLSDLIPGATVLYSVNIQNIGNSIADTVVFIDRVDTDFVYDTVSYVHPGWTIEYSDLLNPDHSYNSEDYSTDPGDTFYWFRAKKRDAAAGDSYTIRYKMILK